MWCGGAVVVLWGHDVVISGVVLTCGTRHRALRAAAALYDLLCCYHLVTASVCIRHLSKTDLFIRFNCLDIALFGTRHRALRADMLVCALYGLVCCTELVTASVCI